MTTPISITPDSMTRFLIITDEFKKLKEKIATYPEEFKNDMRIKSLISILADYEDMLARFNGRALTDLETRYYAFHGKRQCNCDSCSDSFHKNRCPDPTHCEYYGHDFK